MRLRLALAIKVSLVIATSLVLLSLFVIQQTHSDLIAQIDDRMSASLSSRTREMQTEQAPRTPPAEGELRSSASLVIDATGSVTSFRPSGTFETPDPQPTMDPKWLSSEFTRAKGVGVGRTFSDASGSQKFRVMAARRPDGQLEVEATPLRSLNQNISDLIRTLTLGSLAVLGLAALTIFLLLRRSLQPLGSMTEAAARIAEGDISLVPGVASPHVELNELGTSLNVMVERLRNSIDEQATALDAKAQVEVRLRRFVSDASHELQTPITSVRGWAELYRQGGLQGPGDLITAMGRIETESARMGRLVDDLLLLARSDEQRHIELQPVDIGLICADAVTDALAIDAGHQISYVDSRTTISLVAADPDRIRQVLDNLLSNARRHTVAGTSIEMSLVDDARFTEIVVRDHGGGFAPGHLGQVFDRFWAANSTRGSGLGLAIVSAIVEAHHGTVTATNAPTGGAVMTVRLPLPMD